MTAANTTRRERRAAERAARRDQQRKQESGGRRPSILVLSIGAVLVGAVLVGILLVMGFGPKSVEPIQPAVVAAPPAGLIDGRSVGSASAPVTIDVWADFQCPVCQRFALDVEPRLRTGPIADGTVRLTYHDYAFIGPESLDAAVAARAALAAGVGFWPFHDLLYENQGAENKGAFSRARLADMAATLGMDRGAFLAALDDGAAIKAVETETAQGQALGITSTPTLVINGKAYAGLPTWTALSALIDQLAAASPAPSAPVPSTAP